MKLDPTADFTDAERRLIAMFLHRAPSRFDTVFHYGAYVLPSVLFAGYAFATASCAALLLAYASLLIVVIMYLTYSGSMQQTLHSTLVKYESRVRALDRPGERRA
jgi:signal peptidase I